MGIFKRRRYEPPSIASSLDPYHYPIDESGKAVPTPSPRSHLTEPPPQRPTPEATVDDAETSLDGNERDSDDVIDLVAIEADEGADSSPYDAAIANHVAAMVARTDASDDDAVGDPQTRSAHS